MLDAERTELTYQLERRRAVAGGILETAGMTFLLLIAVRYFSAGPISKALIAASASVGLLVSPLVVSTVETARWRTAQAAAWLARIAAGSFLVMAGFPFLPVFILGSLVAMTATSAVIPLVTQIYQENYPERERGRRFSRTVMIRIVTAAAFGEVAGRALSVDLDYSRLLLLVFAGASALASGCLRRCPSQPLAASGGSHPLRALRFVNCDRIFRQTLLAWMLMGFANLMMMPLRVEYLANAEHGITLQGEPVTASTIALLTLVIPNLARLALSPVWGWLFDRMNFFALRMALNMGFALGIVTFFTSQDLTGLVLGGCCYGISHAGGDVAWSLWVTKFSPPERVADYMSVHTFFTGLRGVVAPVVAFQAVSALSIMTVGWISIGLITGSTLMLLPEIRWGRRGRPAAALVEEVSE